ncbi:hypothetical protein PPUN15366_19160 [Pseudomonas putida]|nr:hypothetical protein PPUN15366_19160 [Pseudomonas putida]
MKQALGAIRVYSEAIALGRPGTKSERLCVEAYHLTVAGYHLHAVGTLGQSVH